MFWRERYWYILNLKSAKPDKWKSGQGWEIEKADGRKKLRVLWCDNTTKNRWMLFIIIFAYLPNFFFFTLILHWVSAHDHFFGCLDSSMEIIKALRECPAEVQHANLAVRRNGTLIIEEGITSPSNNYLCGT